MSAQPPVAADIVVLGKIVSAYGLRGAVHVHPFADDPAAWARMKYWWLGREGEAAAGLLIGAPREVLPATGTDEYYWGDLIGLDVVNTKDQPLGRVLGLIETAANDVLRVGNGDGQEQLLPFVAAVVLDVDLSARRVRVEWEADW